jgi:hypothetical protein
MSSCEQIRTELGGYVLGGLEADELEAVEAHASSCRRCRDELDELTETSRLLGKLPTAARPAPADLKQRVLREHRRARTPRTLLIAAAILLAALAGAGMTSLLDRPAPPETVLTLRGLDPAGVSGWAELRQVPNGVQIDLDLDDLHPGGKGYYHGWLHRGDLRVSAGTFVGTEDQEAQVQLLCGGQLEDYDRLTVTWHPFDRDAEVIALDAEVTHRPEDP